MITTEKPSNARLLSVIAATVVSLACGTNYVYSAWGPQFAQRLKLSATDSNLIGTVANLGMYTTGIPFGIMVDRVGPRAGVGLGIALFSVGFYPLAKAFDAGPGVYSVGVLCLFSFFTGAGSSSAFSAAIKVSALNFPESRGTATAFPLAAFGLSAFAFATVALALPHDTPHFLLLLATGTVLLPALSFPFMRVIPSHTYKKLPNHNRQVLHGTITRDTSHQINSPDTGAQRHISKPALIPSASSSSIPSGQDSDENSSLLSDTSSTDMADLEMCKSIESDKKGDTPHLDIRGFVLLRHVEFWQLFCMLGLLTGIGLMTINNIGNDATALWRHWDPSKDTAFIAKRQVMHVSILSVCSFAGRLLSGIGSDVLVKHNWSRFFCLLASALGFTVAQLLAIYIQNPNFLVLVSGVTGISYGMLFGVYPSLVAHTFGVHGLSQNWGTMCLAPVISGNIFNILYGRIYDSHSIKENNGETECMEGRSCYRSAYIMTLGAGIAGILLCLWSINHETVVHKKNEKGRRDSLHERVA